MNEKTLKFGNIEINKKELHKSKQPIDLSLVDTTKIVISDKFKHSDDSFKYFIGYKEDDIVKPLCIVLPQMSRYIKSFENGKNCDELELVKEKRRSFLYRLFCLKQSFLTFIFYLNV